MNTRKIGVLGSGQVGQILADGFLKHGYEVMRGSREPSKLATWKAGAGAKAATGTFAEASRFGDLVVLAVKGAGAEEAVRLCGAGLDGKVVKRIATQGMLPTNLAFALPGNRSIFVTEYEHAQVEIFPVDCDGLRLWDGRAISNAPK